MLTARTTWSTLITAGSAAAITVGIAVCSSAVTAEPTAPPPVTTRPSVATRAPDTGVAVARCPALYALGIQGTGESSPDAAPTTDTGMLSTVFLPLLARAPEPGLVERAYVPYESGFGGLAPGGPVPYADSVRGGLTRLRSMAYDIAQRCPSTRFAVTGYSQGAHVASLFAQEVGRGAGVLRPERIAAVALFADPTRNPGAPLFPGAPDRVAPDDPPGAGGQRVATVRALPQRATGGGIGPDRDHAADFGALTGRVASFCVSGDLACDAPAGAPLLRAVAEIAGQTGISGGDPVTALESIAQALAFTSIKTANAVATGDLRGTAATLTYRPQESISQRLAEAADPRTPVAVSDPLRALLRGGTIGLGAVAAVVRDLLDPAALGQLAAAALSDPAAALGRLSARLTGALTRLVPPVTVSRLVNEAYAAVVRTVTDNRELLDITTWVRYWDTVQRHGAYATAAADARGDAPVRFVADWFAAAARDLSAAGTTAGPSRIAVPPPGASSSSNSPVPGEFPFGSADTTSAGAARPTTAVLPTGNNYPFSTN